jgi:1-acyl-sn-glycerol-3-phosphate acyltransferase
MTDIMLMLANGETLLFVGKQSWARLYYFFCKRTCILVEIEAVLKASLKKVLNSSEKIELRFAVCIFPEGGVPDESILLIRLKIYAFRLAIEHQDNNSSYYFADNKETFLYFLVGS